jgi:protein gp37
MADNTAIQWCDGTVNPVMGCDGCELWNKTCASCYAGILHQRHGGINFGYAVSFDRVTAFPGRVAKAAKLSDLTGRRRQHKPWLDGRPRMIFISDMGDALSQAVSFEYLEAEIIDNATSPAGRRHIWLWLTKRPQRMADFSTWLADWSVAWPTNLWVGTTVTTDKTISRLDELFKVGDQRTVRLVSVEPQLEIIDLRQHLPELDWVIQGGESGSDARPFDVAWARQMRDYCQAAGVHYFLKQLGSNPCIEGKPLRFDDQHGGDWSEWPEDLRIREVPTAVLKPPSEKEGTRMN